MRKLLLLIFFFFEKVVIIDGYKFSFHSSKVFVSYVHKKKCTKNKRSGLVEQIGISLCGVKEKKIRDGRGRNLQIHKRFSSGRWWKGGGFVFRGHTGGILGSV